MSTVTTARASVLAAQAYAVVHASGDPLKRFGFQPFAESTTWHAHLWPYCRHALQGHTTATASTCRGSRTTPNRACTCTRRCSALGVLSAAALSVGLWTRVTSRVCFGGVAYHFFLSETFFHHNRAFLLIFLGGLALCPCGDQLTLTGPNKPIARLLWPLYLWRAEACVPSLASSTSKLFDPEWFAGIVTWDRVERYRHLRAGDLDHAAHARSTRAARARHAGRAALAAALAAPRLAGALRGRRR